MRVSILTASLLAISAPAVVSATVLAPSQPIAFNASTASPGFSNIFDFSVAGTSLISGQLQLLKKAGITVALKDVFASLSYEASPGGWQTVWSDSVNFAQAQKKGSWQFSFDDLVASGGNYRLSLAGSIYPNTNYTGSYLYQLSITAVPEPETFAMMGLGIAALLLRRRRVALLG